MNELKKCPFCGGDARLEDEPIGKGEFLYYVSCVNDGCITQNRYYTKKEEAIKAWNNRKPAEEVVARLEEMKLIRVEQCHDDYEIEVMTESNFDDAIEIVKGEVG